MSDDPAKVWIADYSAEELKKLSGSEIHQIIGYHVDKNNQTAANEWSDYFISRVGTFENE